MFEVFLDKALDIPAAVAASLITPLLLKWWKRWKRKRKPEAEEGSVRGPGYVVSFQQILLILVVFIVVFGSRNWARTMIETQWPLAGDVAIFPVESVDIPGASGEARYTPSGRMGDVLDVVQDKNCFTYAPRGMCDQRHEADCVCYYWDYTYVDGKCNPFPAMFAGVAWLHPPNNWGTKPNGGYDLRGFKWLRWEARCHDGEEVSVEFFIGGVSWNWGTDESGKPTQVPVPYGDTLPRIGMGIHTLDSQWRPFEFPLVGIDSTKFQRVVAAFGWTASWGNNGIEISDDGETPKQRKTFHICVQNIRYEK